jgi:Gluconate 2-dehydrogenase subunit 3
MEDPGKKDLRSSYSAALEKLNGASGGDFSALKAQRRAGVLRELISGDEAFGKIFAAMREDVMRVYFTSQAGMKFIGYRDCTQFEGYPEYLKTAVIWE